MAPTQAQQMMALNELMRRVDLGPLPIHIGTWDDKNTWQIQFTEEETPAERAAAQAVINAFNPEAYIATEQTRRDGIRDDPSTRDLLDRLRTKSGSEIDQWLASNVTNIGQARQVIGAIIKILVTRT